jgi:hypothetical protein
VCVNIPYTSHTPQHTPHTTSNEAKALIFPLLAGKDTYQTLELPSDDDVDSVTLNVVFRNGKLFMAPNGLAIQSGFRLNGVEAAAHAPFKVFSRSRLMVGSTVYELQLDGGVYASADWAMTDDELRKIADAEPKIAQKWTSQAAEMAAALRKKDATASTAAAASSSTNEKKRATDDDNDKKDDADDDNKDDDDDDDDGNAGKQPAKKAKGKAPARAKAKASPKSAEAKRKAPAKEAADDDNDGGDGDDGNESDEIADSAPKKKAKVAASPAKKAATPKGKAAKKSPEKAATPTRRSARNK